MSNLIKESNPAFSLKYIGKYRSGQHKALDAPLDNNVVRIELYHI